MMNPAFRELGAAYAVDPKSDAGIYWTALFGALYTAAIATYLAANPVSPTVQLEALVSGYSVAFIWAAGLMLLAAPISFFLIRPNKADLLNNPDVVHMG